MISFAIAIQFIFAILLTIAVLLQKSSSIGLGAYSGSNESVFGSKGPAGFLTKATFAIGVLFIANTVFLTYSFNKDKNKSVIDTVKVLTPTQNIPAK